MASWCGWFLQEKLFPERMSGVFSVGYRLDPAEVSPASRARLFHRPPAENERRVSLQIPHPENR